MAQAPNVLVVDASVAAKWHLPEATEAHADRALALFARFQAGTISLIAPRHIRFEVPSSLTVAAATTGTPRLTRVEAQAHIDAFLALPMPTFDDTPLLSAVPCQPPGGQRLNRPIRLAWASVLKCSWKPRTAADVSAFTGSWATPTANRVKR